MAKQDTESAKVTDIDSTTVSAAVLGNIFSVTDRRIRQMAEEGIIVRAAKGRYKLVESLKNYTLALKLAAEGANTVLLCHMAYAPFQPPQRKRQLSNFFIKI